VAVGRQLLLQPTPPFFLSLVCEIIFAFFFSLQGQKSSLYMLKGKYSVTLPSEKCQGEHSLFVLRKKEKVRAGKVKEKYAKNEWCSSASVSHQSVLSGTQLKF
jgi:hypothetical protein